MSTDEHCRASKRVLFVAKLLPNGGLLVNDKGSTKRKEDPKKHLTDKTLGALKPAAKEYTVWDDDEARPGFGVRVSPKGARTFFLAARYPGCGNSGRRRLGRYPRLSLANARKLTDEWLELIAKGIDPEAETRRRQDEAEQAKKAEQLKKQNSVPARVEEFLGLRHVQKQRQYKETGRILRKELKDVWGDRLLHEITRKDVVELIKAISDRGSTAMARNVLTVAKVFFEWAAEPENEYVTASPAAGIRPEKLLGEKPFRQRVLDDEELIAFWRATDGMGYPYGPLYRLLLLTGARLREIADARWGEIQKKILTVPPERFKSKVSHLIPLSGAALMTLETLPRFEGGDYLFSFTSGKSPLNSFSAGKELLDQLVAKELGGSPPPWVIHDLRRTVRTRLASLKVADPIAELVVGHGKKGLSRIYDQHSYEPEMREALEQWAGRLRDITEPPPENVSKFKKRA
jgi:integrase